MQLQENAEMGLTTCQNIPAQNESRKPGPNEDSDENKKHYCDMRKTGPAMNTTS